MLTVDFDKLRLRPGARILDIGCGSGRHAAAAAGRGRVQVVAADSNPADLLQVRERLARDRVLAGPPPGRCRLLAADLIHLPFADAVFDLVICAEVLEHIPDHRAAMAELVRVLAPGGDLVVSVPRHLPERLCWALSAQYGREAGGHVRIYRRRELVALLEGAGARPWAQGFAHALHAPYWWLRCLLGPGREDNTLLRAYHRFLVWDLMQRPRLTRALEALLNPLIGKSLVVYLRKNEDA